MNYINATSLTYFHIPMKFSEINALNSNLEEDIIKTKPEYSSTLSLIAPRDKIFGTNSYVTQQFSYLPAD